MKKTILGYLLLFRDSYLGTLRIMFLGKSFLYRLCLITLFAILGAYHSIYVGFILASIITYLFGYVNQPHSKYYDSSNDFGALLLSLLLVFLLGLGIFLTRTNTYVPIGEVALIEGESVQRDKTGNKIVRRYVGDNPEEIRIGFCRTGKHIVYFVNRSISNINFTSYRLRCKEDLGMVSIIPLSIGDSSFNWSKGQE